MLTDDIVSLDQPGPGGHVVLVRVWFALYYALPFRAKLQIGRCMRNNLGTIVLMFAIKAYFVTPH